MDISLIICTRNRAQSLGPCLAALAIALAKNPKIDVQIIFVDNGSSDNTFEILTAWSEERSSYVEIIREDRVGLAQARNTALAVSTGTIISFTDDDCCISRTFFSDIIDSFIGDTSPKIRGGRVLLGDKNDLPITIRTSEAPEIFDGTYRPSGFVSGANLSFHRKVYESIGPFDTRFGAGSRFISAEDTDFIYRAFLKKCPILYDPSITVSHFHGRRKMKDAIKLYKGYCFGDGALYGKYLFKSYYAWRWIKNDIVEAINEKTGRRVFTHLINNYAQFRLGNTIRGMVNFWLNFPAFK